MGAHAQAIQEDIPASEFQKLLGSPRSMKDLREIRSLNIIWKR